MSHNVDEDSPIVLGWREKKIRVEALVIWK